MYSELEIKIIRIDKELLTESPETPKSGVYEQEILDKWTE